MGYREKIATGLVIASLTFGGVGCQDINATKPTTTITETTPSPTTPNSETTPTVETTPATTPTTRPTTETTPATTPTTRPTTETTPATTPTTRPTTEVTTTPTTTPTTETTPTTTPTTEAQSELKDVLPERLSFTKDLLNFYDETIKTTDTNFGDLKNYITRQQIINYGKGGEYLVKVGDVVKFKDNSPAVALINCKNDTITSFKKAITTMETYDPNYLKIIKDNGLVAFVIDQVDGGNDWFGFNKYGGISLNPTDYTISQKDISNFLTWSVLVESFGIKMYQLGGDYEKYVGLMKESLVSDCWWNLYCKNGQKFCEAMSYGGYINAKETYSKYYGISFKDQKIQGLLTNIRTKNLAKSFGGTWSEITQNIPTRPDWNLGDIQ